MVAHSAPSAYGALTTGIVAHGLAERAAEEAEPVVAGHHVALVEDDHAGRAGRGGVVGLHREVARAALDERDVAGGEPAKSAASQPLVEARSPARFTSTARDRRAVDVALTREVHREVVDAEHVRTSGSA